MDVKAELLRLSDFMCYVLSSTEETKEILTKECEEARYALAPWPVETVVTRQRDQNACTCEDKSPLEDQVEEIAEGISRRLLHAQQLREKAASNVAREKKRSREPDLSAIYTAAARTSRAKCKDSDNSAKPTDKRDSVSKITIPSGKCRVRDSSKTVETNTVDVSRAKNKAPITAKLRERGQNEKAMTSEKSSDASGVSKESSKQKLSSDLSKTKGKRNFLLENKLRVKNMKANKGAEMVKDRSKSSDLMAKAMRSRSCTRAEESPRKSRGSSVSTSELCNLIEQVALTSSRKSTASYSDIDQRNCPLHGDAVAEVEEKRIITTVDAIEGLGKYGVPDEIVKASKIYHAYQRLDLAGEIRDDSRTKKPINRFLAEFNKVAETANKKLSEKNALVSLATEGIELFGNFDASNDTANFHTIKKRYSAFNRAYKKFKIKPYDFPETTTTKFPEISVAPYSNFASNGIWSDLSVKYFTGMFNVICMRYSNKNQLQKFFDVSQKLQRNHYLEILIDLIKKDVIPVLESLDPMDKDYVQAYKMIVILIQGLNPKVPVLVRTDK